MGRKKNTVNDSETHFFSRINKGSKFYFYFISSLAGYSGFQVKCGDFYIAFRFETPHSKTKDILNILMYITMHSFQASKSLIV